MEGKVSLIEKLCNEVETANKMCNLKAVFPLNAKKVRICEIMSGGFAVKIQQCVKKSGGFW